jgi:hypothetical protein
LAVRLNQSSSGAGALVPARSGRARPSGRGLLASTAVAILLVATGALPVAAAHGTTTSTSGYDISWPQCGKTFPSGQAFGIVGVNDGLANTPNPCLGPYGGGARSSSELVWASGSTGASKLPRAALYVNTADPGPGVADWPTSNTSPAGADPSGPCDGSDSPACAWEYGWDRATQDIAWLSAAATTVGVKSAASDYPWWLDVETANSWETGSAGLTNNVADLQGMVAALEAAGASVGIYSTSYQWGVITGGSKDGNLSGLDDWVPGARRQSSAQSNCSLPSFTGGTVTITQWFSNPYDSDWAC